MVNCPKCGKPVGGRAHACGYCGESLVQNYFGRNTTANYRTPGTSRAEVVETRLGAGATAATVLGIFGALALLAALVFHLLALFGFGAGGVIPDYNAAWWVQTLAMTLFPVVHLVQQAVLRGLRFSLAFDCSWLFITVCGLGVVIQAYLELGTAPFYGLNAIPYLLALGCVLILVASVTSILSYRE